MSDQRCCQKMHHNFMSYRCGNKGKVEVDGAWYCGIHDPIKRAERDRVQREKWDAEWKARNLRYALDEARDEFLSQCEAAIKEIAAGHNNARDLSSEILKEYDRRKNEINEQK